jgi:hypothetical protein
MRKSKYYKQIETIRAARCAKIPPPQPNIDDVLANPGMLLKLLRDKHKKLNLFVPNHKY